MARAPSRLRRSWGGQARGAAKGWRKALSGFFSLGWDGSNRTWMRYEMVYLLLAGLATPLVLSVHTIVSFDYYAGSLGDPRPNVV